MVKKTPLDYTIYALIFLLLFFGAAALSSQIIFNTELVTLPSLTGLTVEEARTALAAKRTRLAVQGTRFDSRAEKGRILSQDPGPNSRVKTKRTVNVILSDGSERLTVPALEGRSLEFAAQQLKAVGLRRGRAPGNPSSSCPISSRGRLRPSWRG